MRRIVRRTGLPVLAAAVSVSGASCARLDTKSEVDVKPIEVKPIHITVDVNVRVDRELDEFFAFQDEPATPAGPASPATQAATAPVTAPAPATPPAAAN